MKIKHLTPFLFLLSLATANADLIKNEMPGVGNKSWVRQGSMVLIEFNSDDPQRRDYHLSSRDASMGHAQIRVKLRGGILTEAVAQQSLKGQLFSILDINHDGTPDLISIHETEAAFMVIKEGFIILGDRIAPVPDVFLKRNEGGSYELDDHALAEYITGELKKKPEPARP